MFSVTCPECTSKLKLGGHPKLNQRLICTECERSLSIVSLQPLVLDVAQSESKPKPKVKVVELACPVCDHLIRLSPNPHKGQHTGCPACQAEVAIVSVNPLELDLASSEVGSRKHNRLHKIEARSQIKPDRYPRRIKRKVYG